MRECLFGLPAVKETDDRLRRAVMRGERRAISTGPSSVELARPRSRRLWTGARRDDFRKEPGDVIVEIELRKASVISQNHSQKDCPPAPQRHLDAADRQIDQLVCELYGSAEEETKIAEDN